MRHYVKGTLVIVAAVVAVTMQPDIVRYWRISNM
jgi:hypothetical protein